MIYIQWSLIYPDYSLIRTHVWELIPILQQKVHPEIRKFSYTDSQSGNRGVRISEAQLYTPIKLLCPPKIFILINIQVIDLNYQIQSQQII